MWRVRKKLFAKYEYISQRRVSESMCTTQPPATDGFKLERYYPGTRNNVSQHGPCFLILRTPTK
jgi:hypothetical protein